MNRETTLDARKKAAARLAASRDTDAVPALAVLLTEIEPALIADVRSALVAMDATKVLAKRMREATSPGARQDLVRLLGYQLDAAAIPVLLEALEDSAAKVREE